MHPRVPAAAAALAAALVTPPAAHAAPSAAVHRDRCTVTYTGEQVGELGGSTSFGLAINARGDVSGTGRTSTTLRPQLPYVQPHRAAAATLPVVTGGTFGRAMSIDDRGRAVGEVFTPAPESSRAAYWDTGHRLHVLDGLGPTGSAVANSLNNRLTAVGASSGPDKRVTAVTWEGTTSPRALPFLADVPGAVARANDVNDTGVVVGTSSADLPHDDHRHLVGHAVAWQGGAVRDLGALTELGWSAAKAISANRAIVGEAVDTSGATRATDFTWGRAVALPALGGWKHSTANDVNARGQVVGSSSRLAGAPTYGGAATLWQCGTATDLNTVTDGVPAGWSLVSANGINARGQITGYATDGSGRVAAFRLNPRH